jgi:hypothetical protein
MFYFKIQSLKFILKGKRHQTEDFVEDYRNDILSLNFDFRNKFYKEESQNDQILYVIVPFYNLAKTKKRTRLFLEFINR